MWICKMCKTQNDDSENPCRTCGAASPRPAQSSSASSGSKGSRFFLILLAILIIAAISSSIAESSDPIRMYRDVMLGKKTFVSGDTGATATINETYKCFVYDPRHGYAQSFLLADVDNDNEDEVVINLSEEDFRLVLDAQGSKVYGYLFPFRGMKCVCADGTFEYASSAYDSGYAYASFSGRSSNTRHVSYYSYSPELSFSSFSVRNIEFFLQ